MSKSAAKTAKFNVDLTVYGWRVIEDGEHIGLFASQKQALDGVRKRVKSLKTSGVESTIAVTGTEQPKFRLTPFAKAH